MVQLVEIPVEFLVVLCNGERHVTVGNMEIHPTIDFQEFRTMLKHMIGISYNNVTTYLVESMRPEIQSDHRKILKLSPADLFEYGFEYHQISTQVHASCMVEFWLHELHMQRVNNINIMIRDMNGYFYSDTNENFPSFTEAYYPAIETSTSRALCKDCMHAKMQGSNPMFHPCIYDEVVEGFCLTTFGPISRPHDLNVACLGKGSDKRINMSNDNLRTQRLDLGQPLLPSSSRSKRTPYFFTSSDQRLHNKRHILSSSFPSLFLVPPVSPPLPSVLHQYEELFESSKVRDDDDDNSSDEVWPCHQGLVTITSVETPPPPQEETAPENPLTSQGPLFRLRRDLNP
ncbi:hypothetical protein R6Q57_023908 [Mikania cordata]